MSTRKKIPLIDATADLSVTGTVSITGSGSAVITFPTVTSTLLYLSGALGTPASGTLTNCAGLPVSGIAASTSTALGVGSINLGHASDTTISRVSAGVVAIEGVKIPAIAPGTSGNIMQSDGTNWVSQSLATAIGSVFLTLLPVGATWYGGTNSANPSTYLPGHSGATWVANAEGRTIVGKATSGTFATAGSTGGAETVTLDSTQIPAHTHGVVSKQTAGNVSGTPGEQANAGGNGSWASYSPQTQSTGGGLSHNNLQPYTVEYVWKRTA